MEILLYYAYKNKITSNVFINTFMKIYIMKFIEDIKHIYMY